MSTMLIQSGTLDDIADAIRSKTGKVASMTPLEMPDEIESISGGGGETKSVSYLKWKITKVRGTTPHDGVLQMTEFKLYQNGALYLWNANASATSDMTPISGYEASKLIDGSNSTKFATSQWGNVQTNECNIVFSLGETITIDSKTTYSYITGNDEASRDPISWVLYGSADGINWEELDSQTDFTLITSRTTETLINGFLMAKVSGGSGGVSILSGASEPTSSQGADGQIYLKYGNYIYKSFYNGTIIIRENTDDSTDVKAFIVGFVKSSTNYFVIEDSDLLAYLSDITSGKYKGCDAYSSPTAPSFVNYNAFIFIYNNGDVCINTTNASVSARVTGTFYGMVDLGQAPVTNATNYQKNGNQSCDTTIDKVILSAFLKVNGSWQNLINSDIDDVNLGN